jgi:excisionase family DNA binding protein
MSPDLRSVPSLDRLAEHPEEALKLPRVAAVALYTKVVGLLAALVPPMTATPDTAAKPTPTTASPALLTIDDAAARLCVPPSRIKSAIRTGTLKSQKVGHYRRIRPEWLEEFIRDEQKRA